MRPHGVLDARMGPFDAPCSPEQMTCPVARHDHRGQEDPGVAGPSTAGSRARSDRRRAMAEAISPPTPAATLGQWSFQSTARVGTEHKCAHRRTVPPARGPNARVPPVATVAPDPFERSDSTRPTMFAHRPDRLCSAPAYGHPMADESDRRRLRRDRALKPRPARVGRRSSRLGGRT